MNEKEILKNYFQEFTKMLKAAGLNETVIIFKNENEIGVMHVGKGIKSPLMQGISHAVGQILKEHINQAKNN